MVVVSVLDVFGVLRRTDERDRGQTGPHIRVGTLETCGEAGERAEGTALCDQQPRLGGQLCRDVEEPVIALLSRGHHTRRRRVVLSTGWRCAHLRLLLPVSVSVRPSGGTAWTRPAGAVAPDPPRQRVDTARLEATGGTRLVSPPPFPATTCPKKRPGSARHRPPPASTRRPRTRCGARRPPPCGEGTRSTRMPTRHAGTATAGSARTRRSRGLEVPVPASVRRGARWASVHPGHG